MSIVDVPGVSRQEAHPRSPDDRVVRSSAMYPALEIDPHLDGVAQLNPYGLLRLGQRFETSPQVQTCAERTVGALGWRRERTAEHRVARTRPLADARRPGQAYRCLVGRLWFLWSWMSTVPDPAGSAQ